MANEAHKKKLLEAIEGVLAANRNVVEVLTEVSLNETSKPEDVKEMMDGLGAIVQAFFAIDVAMKKIRAGLIKESKDEKTD